MEPNLAQTLVKSQILNNKQYLSQATKFWGGLLHGMTITELTDTFSQDTDAQWL